MSDTDTPHRRRRRPPTSRCVDDATSSATARIEPIEIQEEMERSFLDYSMSVIMSRALPDVRDGLKPVHRRILWGMHDLGARPDRPYMKCARVTGEVMGKYHPHGDGAIYDALVRMAQDFSLRHPLVDGHGNFGSPDFGPAASRYTECRLAPLAMRMLDGIDEDTVDFSRQLLGRVPGAGGPARPVPEPAGQRQPGHRGRHGHQHPAPQPRRGHRRHHPPDRQPRGHARRPHAVRARAPTSPPAALIMGRQGIIDAYRTGRGSIRLRAVAEIEEATKRRRPDRRHRDAVPGRHRTASSTKIKELVETREIEGIADVNDESARRQDPPRHQAEARRARRSSSSTTSTSTRRCRRTSRSTRWRWSTACPARSTSLQALLAYIDHQVEVIRRRSEFRLRQGPRARPHRRGPAQGPRRDRRDHRHHPGVRATGRRPSDALMAAPFEFTEVQAEHILDMQLGRLTRLGRVDLEEEMAELRATIAELEAILGDEPCCAASSRTSWPT